MKIENKLNEKNIYKGQKLNPQPKKALNIIVQKETWNWNLTRTTHPPLPMPLNPSKNYIVSFSFV